MRTTLVAVCLSIALSLGYVTSVHAESKLLPILRWTALGAITLNDVTVIYPQKSDVRAGLAAGANWGITWGYWEKAHPSAAKIIYVTMIVGNAWSAGYKIHARWGGQQF